MLYLHRVPRSPLSNPPQQFLPRMYCTIKSLSNLLGRPDLLLGEGNEMIDYAPFFSVPFQIVGAGGEIAAIEKHPDQTVVLKFFA